MRRGEPEASQSYYCEDPRSISAVEGFFLKKGRIDEQSTLNVRWRDVELERSGMEGGVEYWGSGLS